MPKYRRMPSRVDDSSRPHQFSSPRDYFRHLYFHTCDLFLNELEDRFQGSSSLAPVLALELILIKAANGEDYNPTMESLQESCFSDDIDFAAFTEASFPTCRCCEAIRSSNM